MRIEESFDVDGFIQLFSNGIAKWKFEHRQPEHDDEVCVFSVEEYKGLEADMVLYIHGNEATDHMNYIAYTRAKYYLIELVRNF